MPACCQKRTAALFTVLSGAAPANADYYSWDGFYIGTPAGG